MEQDEKLTNQACPFCGGDNSINEEFRDQEWSGSKPYGSYGYEYPNFYGYEYPYWLQNGYHNGWDGHHEWNGHQGWDGYHGHNGGHRDVHNDQRNDYGSKHYMKPMPMTTQPILKPMEKNYSEFKLLEQKVNITEINNIIIKIEKKHPYMIKRLMMLGIVEAECKKILYLALMCSGKFDL